jgi:hypothetical protein
VEKKKNSEKKFDMALAVDKIICPGVGFFGIPRLVASGRFLLLPATRVESAVSMMP